MKIVPIILVIFSLLIISCAKTDDNPNSSSSSSSSTYSDNATTFTVSVSSSKYYIDSAQTKSLTLKKGYIYFFNATDITTNSHPLFIGTTSTGGSYSNEYTSGVTNSRTTTETLTFVVPSDSPSTLYYNCGNHSSMGGTITILD